jgi:2-dehydro-3-deoxyphosphooctonate aldolase (KDO 8-P synthase)
VIESEALCFEVARHLKKVCARLGITYVFKASYDKANRTSGKAFRGPGLDDGLVILERLRTKLDLPIITDVHNEVQALAAGEVVDILQIPAFLCRQTDLIEAAVATEKIVNLKKGQFLSPQEMSRVVEKAKLAGGVKLLVTERGTTFGYNNLVSDMRGLAIMRKTGCPVVFDATHSVQLPGGLGGASGGQREFVPVLARAAVAAGVAGLFMETHPDPARALSDGPNAWPLPRMEALLNTLCELDALVKRHGFPEQEWLA